MISFRKVAKSFGEKAVISNLTLDINAGEHVVLLGSSGSGKTTTLRMLNRLIDPTYGTILINDVDITTQPRALLRSKMGYVMQRNSLFPHYNVEENISVVPKLLKWEKSKIKARVGQLLEMLRLPPDYLRRYPRELSGGEAQRVNLARALAADPDVLLMDEPFNGLDPITRKSIRQELMNLDEFNRKTIVMVTHDIQEAFIMGSVICLLDQGRLVQKGTPADLLYKPANHFVQQFLSDHFLQLSLDITRLTDLWSYLLNDGDDNSEDESALGLSSDISLWQAMEKIKDNDDDGRLITIRRTQTGEWKRTTLGGLLDAYTLFQNNKKQ